MKENFKEDQRQKGYYVYSVFAVIGGFILIGFICYLLYDLFNRLATNEITNATLIQTIVTLILTIFLGGYFTKQLELRNNKKLECLKTEKEIAIKIIDLVGNISRNEDVENSKNKLLFESYKAELFFNEETSEIISRLSQNINESNIKIICNTLRKYFKK